MGLVAAKRMDMDISYPPSFLLTVSGKGSPCRIIAALPVSKTVAWGDMMHIGTCSDT